MNEQQHLDSLKDIKQMMEKSSRFISLSGLSGIAAGVCALAGAAFAYPIVRNAKLEDEGFHPSDLVQRGTEISIRDYMGNSLFQIAVCTFIAALAFAFLFTYLRSKKTNTPVWGKIAKRLMVNVSIPLIAGGIYLFRLVQLGAYGLVAPGCLIFYGLALLNASKYTLKEIRYLGICEIGLGIVNVWFLHTGLYLWAVGFGVLHIYYGAFMWWKYERN
jgi:hypothetical protein